MTGRFINLSGDRHSLSHLTLAPPAGWCLQTLEVPHIDETVHGSGQGNHMTWGKIHVEATDLPILTGMISGALALACLHLILGFWVSVETCGW